LQVRRHPRLSGREHSEYTQEMAALRHLADHLPQGMLPKFLVSCATLVILAAAGCQAPEAEHVISNLPAPTTGYRSRPPQAPPKPKQPIAAVPKWRSWLGGPKATPPRVKSTFSFEPGWVPPIGIGRQWECIVIHHSANDKDTPRSMDAWHRQRGWECLGYDFVIGNGVGYPDGQVFVGPRWTQQKVGAHCKTPGAYYNEHGIGICLIGNMEDHRPTPRQMETLARLVVFLQGQCGIPQNKILMHGGITHKTACPGRYFSIGDLTRRINMQP
jgi:hypothetical protein